MLPPRLTAESRRGEKLTKRACLQADIISKIASSFSFCKGAVTRLPLKCDRSTMGRDLEEVQWLLSAHSAACFTSHGDLYPHTNTGVYNVELWMRNKCRNVDNKINNNNKKHWSFYIVWFEPCMPFLPHYIFFFDIKKTLHTSAVFSFPSYHAFQIIKKKLYPKSTVIKKSNKIFY